MAKLGEEEGSDVQPSVQEESDALFETESSEVSAPAASVPPKPHRGTNLLNDLSPREWLLGTKSVWYEQASSLVSPELEQLTEIVRAAVGDERAEELLGQVVDGVMLSAPPVRDALKMQHPATYPETDIERLIRFFSKQGETVLDPFLGSGSTLIAARRAGRRGIGIELVHRWAEIAQRRLNSQPSLFVQDEPEQTVLEGDSLQILETLDEESVDFIVTSPPYWSVLNKPADHKVRSERVDRGLETKYSDEPADLGNIESYDDFLDALQSVFERCARVLRSGRYVAVVVSDFRDKSKFHMFHADVANVLEAAGLSLTGIIILVQDSKTLYPYGMPYAFVSNIHHQYVVIAKNAGEPRARRKARGERRPF